jgi:hypothetical protein
METVLTPIPPIDIRTFIPVGTTTVGFDLRDFGSHLATLIIFWLLRRGPPQSHMPSKRS